MSPWHKEDPVMVDLEEMRAEHAKKLKGLTAKEKSRVYREEGERAIKILGLGHLMRVEKASSV